MLTTRLAEGEALGKKAIKDMLSLQPGDVPDTFADSSELESATGYKPSMPVKEGVANFVNWYLEFYGNS